MSNPELHSGAVGAQLETIEQTLGELELDELATAPETIEELHELDPEQERAVEAAIARSEVYAESEASATTIGEEPAAAETPTPKARGKKASAGGGKRVPRDLNTLAPEAFVLTVTPPADLDANKSEVLALRPKQVKIAEKFDNILTSLSVGKPPSVYIMTCFKTLEAMKTVKSADLVAAIQASTTKGGSAKAIGTARSQTGQIMNLFAALGIATRNGNMLTLNDESALAAKLALL